MQIDSYTKTVLTVIAVALIGINIALVDRVVKPAYAQTEVYVSNASEIGEAVGNAMYVWCKSCS